MSGSALMEVRQDMQKPILEPVLVSNMGSDSADLAAKVAFLSAMPGIVSVIETHMSFVFLSKTHAFKLKKPVRFANFDHRTLHARERACNEELRVNRALAGDVYIGLLPVKQVAGKLAMSGQGPVVDWLVCMTRLPADRMLDARITAGLTKGQGPSLAEVAAVANALNRFYHVQRLRRPLRGVYFAHLTKEQAANTQNLMELGAHLPDGAPVALLADLTERIVSAKAEIAGREEAHLIVEGHGDLRPEHVCLLSPPVIFDRVETAPEMRIIDIFDEVGNLATECALLGRTDLRAVLFEPMLTAGLALPSARLMVTYGMFRLVTRARLSLDHLRDDDCKNPAKWVKRATDYLAAAAKMSPNDRSDRAA